MPFKLFYNGIEIQCDRAEDVTKVAKSLASGNGSGSAAMSASRELSVASFKDFLGRLHKNQRRLLMTMLNGEDIVTDRELQQALQMKDNKRIGAILAGISKHAKKSGFTLDALWVSEKTQTPDGYVRHFSITPTLKRVAAEAGTMK